MAYIEDALYTKLLATSGVSDLIVDRVYPQIAPDDVEFPFVTFQRISGTREQSHEGSSNLAHGRFQISSYAQTYEGAKELANQIRLALDAFTGTVLGVNFQYVDLVFELDTHDQETKLHRVLLDFVIWYAE